MLLMLKVAIFTESNPIPPVDCNGGEREVHQFFWEIGAADSRTNVGDADNPIPAYCGAGGASANHLIDGTYELNFRLTPTRFPPQGDDRGREVGAVRGVLRSLLGMLSNGATHLAVATDHVIESFRNGLWAAYKTGDGIERCQVAAIPAAGGSPEGSRDCSVAYGRIRSRRCA